MTTQPWGFQARTIRWAISASDAVDAAREKHGRFGEAVDGLEWLLARKPDVGSPALVHGETWWIYVIAGNYASKNPEIWVLYKFDDSFVDVDALYVEDI